MKKHAQCSDQQPTARQKTGGYVRFLIAMYTPLFTQQHHIFGVSITSTHLEFPLYSLFTSGVPAASVTKEFEFMVPEGCFPGDSIVVQAPDGSLVPVHDWV
jgi:hypothetical protein